MTEVSGPWIVRLSARWNGPRIPGVLDWVIAVGCFAGFTLPVLLDGKPTQHGPGTAAAFGAAAALPLIVRRRWPVPVVVVVAAVYVTATLAGVAFTPIVSNAGPNLAIAVFTAADRCPRRWSVAVAAVAAAATWAVLPVGLHLHPHQDQDAIQAILAAAGWVTGDAVRTMRGYERRLAVQEQERARAEERLRLSREVHDVVSHSLSAIAVQAGVARVVLDQQPAQAGVALAAIESASRSALAELRNLLRQIRDPEGTEDPALPALAELPALTGRLRRAGLDVTYQAGGQARAYPAAVELSAYRIVQEALTNITRHAPGARASVRVTHGADSLTITVMNDRPPGAAAAPGTGSGMGIAGMRERAAMLGGTLAAEPTAAGGFAVTARLPAGEVRP